MHSSLLKFALVLYCPSLLETVGLRVPAQYTREFSMFNVCSSSKTFPMGALQLKMLTSRFYEAAGLERGPLSLVRTTEELLGRNSSGSGLENRD
jgi:hypothetical protein